MVRKKITKDDIENSLLEMGEKAKLAARGLATMSTLEKNTCLERMAEAVEAETTPLLEIGRAHV